VRTAGLIRSSHDDSHIVMLQISGLDAGPARRAIRTMFRSIDAVQRTSPIVLDSRATSRKLIKLPPACNRLATHQPTRHASSVARAIA